MNYLTPESFYMAFALIGISGGFLYAVMMIFVVVRGLINAVAEFFQ